MLQLLGSRGSAYPLPSGAAALGGDILDTGTPDKDKSQALQRCEKIVTKLLIHTPSQTDCWKRVLEKPL